MPRFSLIPWLVGGALVAGVLAPAPAEAQFLKKVKKAAAEAAGRAGGQAAGGQAAGGQAAGGQEAGGQAAGDRAAANPNAKREKGTQVVITDESLRDLLAAIGPQRTELAANPTESSLRAQHQRQVEAYGACVGRVTSDYSKAKEIPDAEMDAHADRVNALFEKSTAAMQKNDMALATRLQDSAAALNDRMQRRQFPAIADCGAKPPMLPPKPAGGEAAPVPVPAEFSSKYSRWQMGQLRERVAIWVNGRERSDMKSSFDRLFTDAELAALDRRRAELEKLADYFADDRVDPMSWRDLRGW